MSDDDYGRVPAGWYPDPLGLPQLRWWDNHAWTEHVSDARQPMVPTRPTAETAFVDDVADDQAPERRVVRGTDPPREAPTAAALRQLAAPYGAAPEETAPGRPSGEPALPDSPWVPLHTPSAATASAAEPDRESTPDRAAPAAPHLQSVASWTMALLPMLQLLLSLLALAAYTAGPSAIVMAVVWLGPYPLSIVLAWLDHRSLRRQGVDRPASWLWALGSPVVYLTARAVQLSRLSTAGYGPLAVLLLLAGLVGASVIAVPGLVIAALPTVFADEASASVERSAVSIGGPMEVTCPATPPLSIGQQLRCPATTADGDEIVITVSLQRANGWITWQVDDWGIFDIIR